MSGNITKRGKRSWRIKYDAGRDPITGRRKTIFKTVKGTKTDAQAELTKALNAVLRGSHVDPTRLTVGEYLKQWITGYRTQISAKTAERYGDIIDKHLIPGIGAHLIQKLQAHHLREFYTKAAESGRLKGGKLAPRTVGHFHRVLFSALRQAMLDNIVVTNVAGMVKPPKVGDSEVKTVDETELGRVLEVARSSPFYVPVMLAATTGLRRSEVLGLRWKDINLKRGSVHIVQVIEQTRAGIGVKETKTKKSKRAVILPAIIVDELRKYKTAQAEARLAIGLGKDDDGLVFADPLGNPPDPEALTKAFARIVRRAKVPRITLHGLRHSHATLLLKENVNPKIVSERLGHASVKTTLDIYSHVLPTMQDDAAQKVDAALRPALKDG